MTKSMKYFAIDAKITEELLSKFYEFANANVDFDWTISIWSTGGVTVFAKTIIYIINTRKERVTLICNEAYSAAFEIFYFSKCKKVICKEGKGLVHFSYANLTTMRNGKINDPEHESIVQNWKDDKGEMLWAKKLLTPKELIKFNKGEDVYFTTKRLKEIFPNAEVI